MPQGYYRYPTIHQDNIVFVCEDDLWCVSAQGGIARRLTSGLGEVSMPILSPNGQQVAFVGNEEGEQEIYVMPTIGGPVQRLTHYGMNVLMAGWSSENEILFGTDAGQPFSEMYWLHVIDPRHPSTPSRLDFGPARAIALSFKRKGKMGVVLGRNTGDPAKWKRYRGGQAGRLWINSGKNGTFVPLIELDSNLASPMWLNNNRIYFISDHEGVGNLYSCTPNGKGLRRHTEHSDFYVRHARSDGNRIVYHAGADLYVFDPEKRASHKVEVDFYSPQTQRSRKFVDATWHLNDYALSPNGSQLAITSRGKLFTFWNFEGAVTQHGETALGKTGAATGNANSNASVRYRLPTWIGDGEVVLAIGDEGGEEAFIGFPRDTRALLNHEQADYLRKANEQAKTLNIGRVTAAKSNPKRGKIAFTNHRYELLVLDFEEEEMKLKVVDRGLARPIEGFDWSPDGEWLAYGCSISLQKSAIKLWNAETGEIRQVTRPVLKDTRPAFDPEGRYLYFLSQRLFDPVYDHMHFDLSFPRGTIPCLVTLRNDLPSPFIPRPPSGQGDEERKDEAKPNEGAAAEASTSDTPAEPNPPETPPDAPQPAAEAVAETATSATSATGDATPTSEAQSTAPPPQDKKSAPPKLHIDFDGIEARIMAFPVTSGLYGNIAGIKGKKVLYTYFSPDSGGGSLSEEMSEVAGGNLECYDLEDRREDTLATGVSDFKVTPDGGWVLYRAGQGLRVFKAGEKPEDGSSNPRKRGWVNLHRVRVAVSPPAEWQQMFREAWRLQRDNFWTPDMSQVDWLAVYHRYLPLVDRISSRSEFTDLMWEMQGELGTSHAYVWGGDGRWPPYYSQGYLGADFEWDEQAEGWRVQKIVRGDSWDARMDSPLAGAGINVKVGDILLEVNGQRLSREISPEHCLVHQAGNEVTLIVAEKAAMADENVESKQQTPEVPAQAPEAVAPPKTDSAEKTSAEEAESKIRNPKSKIQNPRVVMVKTLRNDRPARYRAWIEANRARVHEATQGRAGYLHIPDMNAHGYAEFHRGFLAEVDREALIVDVRYNQGGHVSQLILEKLSRRRLGYDVSRWGQIPTPYPFYALAGPIVAITNEHTVSDGDMFSHAFKLMKLGPVIGTRTWGGVIGISGYRRLIDGGGVSQPEFAGWFNDVGWKIENFGAQPDIVVDNLPEDWMDGIDAQLDRAISEINQMLVRNPPNIPTFDNRPSRELPRLGR